MERRKMVVERVFTKDIVAQGKKVWDLVDWERRDASIKSEDGKAVFNQQGVEIPKSWSNLALNVVASKYFRGHLGSPERENSVKHLIHRVANTIQGWGAKGGYFATPEDASRFRDELTAILLTQRAAFNSPVWFNVGVEEHPQCSACFINSVDDSMESILGLAKTEGMLFKYGSGTGSNLSKIRSSKETLKGGGGASGPVSFMKGFDAFAGVIKSGGKTRRAAKMVILDADHPDILTFIRCKADEEKKAHALIDAGYDGSFNGEAYGSVFFQNSNNSVRVSDDFMHRVEDRQGWSLTNRTDGKVAERVQARELFEEIARAAWECGDPGLQFDTTINEWHTCPNTDRINGSNPCSEYMFLDDTACNLASLNLMKFYDPARGFLLEEFGHAIRVVFTAMEIIVSNSSYPTPKIAENSEKFRPLGLGYANLGALLMAEGLPYDSDEGRDLAAAITAFMCGEAYQTSAVLATVKGAFEGYAKNAEPMDHVIEHHLDETVKGLARTKGVRSRAIWEWARNSWAAALKLGRKHGFRNSQATVLAPTGTIGFMMDCDTTGVEPDIALVKYKTLVGGGQLKIVNNTVPLALAALGYGADLRERILKHIDETGTIEGAKDLKPEHLAVFDCAFKPAKGERSISWSGHIRMMAAVQPFLSGAISKTVNMPANATVEDIAAAYRMSWELGLKAIAVYRDGCKRSQPLNTSKDGEKVASASLKEPTPPYRRHLPDERKSITHKFAIAGHEGYVTVGMYEDGTPGEMFVTMSKEGSTISGMMDSFATVVSLALQYGVPLADITRKLSHTRFEPSGFTPNAEIRMATSIVDYLMRWMDIKFAPKKAEPSGEEAQGMYHAAVAQAVKEANAGKLFQNSSDAPPCPNCGTITVRSGACHKCMTCGTTTGCS